MPRATARVSAHSPPLQPESLRWAIWLLAGYALIHVISAAFIPWEFSWEALALAAFLFLPNIGVPLIAALGLRARAQWAWYLAIMFGGYTGLRGLLVVAMTVGSPSQRARADLWGAVLPIAGMTVMCAALIIVLARADARKALGVRGRVT